jgi:GT2 family glycosyltransferase
MATVTGAITLYNRAGYINVLLQSLFDSVEEGLDVLAVVVDNGSSDDSVAVARSFGDRVRVIENGENLPLTRATNQAVDAALEDDRTDYILVLNDDVSLMEGCLRKLVDVCADQPQSLVTPLQLQYDEPHDIDDGAYEPIPAMRPIIQDAILGRPMKEAYSTTQIVGAALFASREAYMHIGPFDETFKMYGLDTDYYNRAVFLGYDLLLVPKAHCLHAHGRFMFTPKKDPRAWMRRWETMLLARYVLVLKNPAHGLLRNYLMTLGLTVKNVLQCAGRLWLPGIWATLRTQLSLLARCGQVRARYRADFDSGKRLAKRGGE